MAKDLVLKTPYKDLCPAATPEELALLKADLKAHAVTDPIVIDTDGNILDGHKRYAFDPKAPTKVLAGSDKMTEGEKEAYVVNRRDGRARTPTPQETLKRIALKLKHEGKSQAEVGKIMGKDRSVISRWLGFSNVQAHNTESPPPDNRRKLSDEERAAIVELVRNGQKQKDIAEQYGISAATVSGIITRARKSEGNGQPASPGKPPGKITKNDLFSVRLTAAKADVQAGGSIKKVCSRYALSSTDYQRGKLIVEREHLGLVKALDEDLFPIGTAYRIAKQTDDEITQFILAAEEKAAVKRGKARSVKGQTMVSRVLQLLGPTYDTWAAFKQNVRLRSTSIPEAEKPGLRTKCKAVRQIVKDVLDSIEGRL